MELKTNIIFAQAPDAESSEETPQIGKLAQSSAFPRILFETDQISQVLN